jgi:hypothetical protein
MNVYTLKLTNGKYFVGGAPVEREQALKYFSVYSNNWTRKYPIVEIVSVVPIELTDNEEVNALNVHYEVDRMTSLAMLKYSIENVRGGSMIEVEMPRPQLLTQRQFLKDCKEICYKCYSVEHEVADCNYQKKMVQGASLDIEWKTTPTTDYTLIEGHSSEQIVTPFDVFSSSHIGADSEHTTSDMFSSSFCSSSYR